MITLRPYQQLVVDALKSHLIAGEITTFRIVSGAGRSIILADVLKSFKHPVFVSNRVEMRNQMLRIASEMGLCGLIVMHPFRSLDYEGAADVVIICETVIDPTRSKVEKYFIDRNCAVISL